MGENYVVNYDINVQSQAALQALNSFQQATNKLSQAGKQLTAFQKKIEVVTSKLNQMSRKAPVLDIATSKVNKKLDAVIVKMEKIHRLARQTASLNINTSGGGNPRTQREKPAQPVPPGGFSRAAINNRLPKNLSYRLLGPTPLDVGGVGAVDLLKGMGIAYGIAGIGNMIRTTLSSATEYDNIMQTAKNILGTHDHQSNFLGRFSQMAQTVRNVGVETKFTAPQVAGAVKFLAMAGLDINAINQSIRPIADVALIGDTDLGETADVVTNIMTSYGISPDRVRSAADIMTMTFTKSNTTLMEIAEAYKYSASLLSAGGVDFEEATAGFGILGDAGIKGSQAGTTMRTIMANLVNPTKKQLSNWERVGVARTDTNGHVRPLVEIFKDLSRAGLYVDDFYKLFHKTAAQGAVSLANNVNKWNDIIKDNFMSDGVAKQLADAKKNTIVGLWAQLTSQFTENGMQAFESIQQPIKEFLNEIITWLKQPEAANIIKGLAEGLLDFMRMIKDVTKAFLEWYGPLKSVIKAWLELQLRMMPLLAGFKILKALLLGGAGIVKFAGGIAFLTGKVGLLAKTFREAYRSARMLGAMNWIGGRIMNPIGTYFKGNFYNGLTGKDVRPEVWQRYWAQQNANHNTTSAIGARGAFVSNALKLGVGAIGGGLAGNAIGKTIGGETGGAIGGLLGGAAGIGLLAMGGPIGWAGAIVLALGGLAAAWRNSSIEAERAQKSFDDFAYSVKMVNGVLSGENLTTTEKYLEIVYNKQLSLNDVISKRIALLKEELGLQDPPKVESNNESISGTMLQKSRTLLDETDNWLGSATMAQNAATLANQFGRKAIKSSLGDWYWYEAVHGNSKKINNPDGGNDAQDALAAISALYREGIAGSEQTKIKEELQKRLAYILTHNGTWEDIVGVKNDWASRYGKWSYSADTHPTTFAYGLDDIANWDADKISSSYTYKQGLFDSTKDVYGPDAKVWRVANTYWGAVNANKVTEDQVVQYMSLMDTKLGSVLGNYTLVTIDNWVKSLGYWDGTFHEMNGNPASTVAATTRSALDRLLETGSRLSAPAQNATRDLFGLVGQLRGMANGFVYTSNGGKASNVQPTKEGATMKLDGVKYTFKQGVWLPDHGVMLPMSDQEMQANLAARGSQHDGNTPPSGGSTGANQSNYKSHYNNNSAAPKQVIVKIENLMNVESVDLSNPDNAAVIADLKGQLTQALVDVVHDFDETYHG